MWRLLVTLARSDLEVKMWVHPIEHVTNVSVTLPKSFLHSEWNLGNFRNHNPEALSSTLSFFWGVSIPFQTLLGFSPQLMILVINTTFALSIWVESKSTVSKWQRENQYQNNERFWIERKLTMDVRGFLYRCDFKGALKFQANCEWHRIRDGCLWLSLWPLLCTSESDRKAVVKSEPHKSPYTKSFSTYGSGSRTRICWRSHRWRRWCRTVASSSATSAAHTDG